jgi:type III pantothenate kinase
MQSGIFWGYIGLIEGIVGRLLAEAEVQLPVIATGGLAHLFAGATNVITTVDPDLTLRGLLLIYERNRA